jgi:5,6-dimethylbenzimidazole synthase
MDLFEAIKGRRSCRDYLTDPVPDSDLQEILGAGTYAPSPLNAQPWEFIVITSGAVKEKIFSEANRCRQWAMEKTGWKWLGKYNVDFLKTAPVIIAVIGDPEKTGVDMFQEEGRVGYHHACAAAIQNIHLASHALGYSTLWFTLFDKKIMREILGVPQEKMPLAIVCLGRAASEIPAVRRKDLNEKVRYIR